MFLFTDKRFFFDTAHTKKEPGFYIFGCFCQFVYSLLQFIVPDAELPAVENWDGYLGFVFTDTNVVGVDDFLPNSPLREVLQRCQIGTPNSFLLLVIIFLRSTLQLLLGHSVAKSKVLRGLASFDPSVMCFSTEAVYTECITSLVNSFLAFGWVSQEDRDVIIGEYRGYLLLLRENGASFSDNFVAELFNDYCFLARSHLVRTFKLAYLCSEKVFTPLPDVAFSLPTMGMSRIHMVSALNCLRSAFDTFADLEETLTSDKSVLYIRGLLDRKELLYHQRGYNVFTALEQRDRSSLFSRLNKSHSRFDPLLVKGTDAGKKNASKTKPPRKTVVGFADVPGTSQPREKLASQSGSAKKPRKGSDRSRSPSEDAVFVGPLPAPKGKFKKGPQPK